MEEQLSFSRRSPSNDGGGGLYYHGTRRGGVCSPNPSVWDPWIFLNAFCLSISSAAWRCFGILAANMRAFFAPLDA
jgi:hypothetical protein